MLRLSSIAHCICQSKTVNNPSDVLSHLKLASPDPILGTLLAYKADPSEIKMNLGTGTYYDDNEKPYVY